MKDNVSPQSANPTSGAGPVVELNGTELSYPTPEGELPVLRGLDLAIHPAEIVAVMGPSGSGKSSLIAIMGGLERATGGAVNVLGQDLLKSTEAELTKLRRKEIGIVFQSYHLVPAMTAVQNVALPLLLSGEMNATAKAKAILERVGLGDRLSHRPSALSGGEQQRVAVARAFVGGPKLILADEPTGNLDQETGADVAQSMFSLVRDTNAAMVLVTHDPVLAGKCDRSIAINAGRIAGPEAVSA